MPRCESSVTDGMERSDGSRRGNDATTAAAVPIRRERHEEDRLTRHEAASRLIDGRIKELNDWRGETLSRVRTLIKQADPEVVEEWKWRGVPVWSHGRIICTGETYKAVVKLTLAKGTSLDEPSELFNASLDGNARRAIDIRQLFTRPALRWSPYRTSTKGIYICSSSTPPGGGVHGMCGYHAARRVLKDVFNLLPPKQYQL